MRPVFTVPALALPVLALAATLLPAAVPPPAGAYRPSEITPEVRDAAAFAVREHGRRDGSGLRLLEVTQAERQVVAGMNFRMTLRVAQGRTTRSARAVVYRPLQGSLQLTSWEWLSGVSVATPK